MSSIQSLVGAAALVATTATAQSVSGSPLPPIEQWKSTAIALHPDLNLELSESELPMIASRIKAKGPSRVFTTIAGGHIFYTGVPDAKGVAPIVAIYSRGMGLCKRVSNAEPSADRQSEPMQTISAPSYQLNVIGTAIYNTAYASNLGSSVDAVKLAPIFPSQAGEKISSVGANFACLSAYQNTPEASAAARDMSHSIRVLSWLNKRHFDSQIGAILKSMPSSAPAPR